MTTPWPDRNFVAEWKTRSAPCSNGCIRYGVVNVESTSSGRPCSCASAATRGMSSTSSPGLPSVSPNSSACLGRIAARQRVEVARIDERRLDAEARQRVVEQVVRAAVERARRDDVRARAEQRDDRQMQRRLPARRRDRADAAFERGDALLEHRARRVGDARIDVARALHVEQRRGVIAVAGTRTTRTGRSASRARRSRDRARAGVQRQRVEAGRPGLGHGVGATAQRRKVLRRHGSAYAAAVAVPTPLRDARVDLSLRRPNGGITETACNARHLHAGRAARQEGGGTLSTQSGTLQGHALSRSRRASATARDESRGAHRRRALRAASRWRSRSC